MPRKTNLKKIERSKQGKSSSDFALESIPIEFEFDMDTIAISDDVKKQRKLVNPMAYFLISFFLSIHD